MYIYIYIYIYNSLVYLLYSQPSFGFKTDKTERDRETQIRTFENHYLLLTTEYILTALNKNIPAHWHDYKSTQIYSVKELGSRKDKINKYSPL